MDPVLAFGQAEGKHPAGPKPRSSDPREGLARLQGRPGPEIAMIDAMSMLNTKHNRAVWFDIFVVDLKRANAFYSAVLDVRVDEADFDGFSFSVLEHDEGNGGCLVPGAEQVSSDKGILLYLNVDGRIRDAAAKTAELGGKIIEDVHAIGPHGFRAIVQDSEGNRIALHSESDA